MATSRPTSLILPSDGGELKHGKTRPAFQPDLSSSSSVDSSSANHGNSHDRQSSSSQNFVRTATASTTTDSDLDSEQDEQNSSQPRKSVNNSQEQLSRRMKHFQKLFKDEIGDEMPELIDSYVCAYQGDILLQGKMYITDRYLCFHSRIISYVTRHVHRWERIEDVTKERVAFIFPTAIGIQLKHSDKKLVYASFLQRDQAFDKIYSVWTSVVNGVSSHDDDDDVAQDGTLKAATHARRASGRQRESYEVIDGPDPDDEPDVRRRNSHKRPLSVPPPKNASDRHSTQTTMGNSHGKKSSAKNSTVHPKRSNENLSMNNQPRHRSRFSKHEKKPSDPEQKNHSSTNHRRKSSASRHPPGQSDDPTPRSADRPLPQSTSSAAPLLTRSASVPDAKSSRPLAKLLALIAPVVNLTSQTFLSLVHHVQTLPLKATTCMFLFLILLFFHAFYLMKVANRIEHRLQSLHHLWPSTNAPLAPSPKNL